MREATPRDRVLMLASVAHLVAHMEKFSRDQAMASNIRRQIHAHEHTTSTESNYTQVEDLIMQHLVQAESAMTAAIGVIACHCAEAGRDPRRVVERAEGKWRGSTLGGYVFRGDDVTYRKHFRMSRDSFDRLHFMLLGSEIASDLEDEQGERVRETYGVPPKSLDSFTSHCRSKTDPPTTAFKMGSCLYAMAHGGPLQSSADVASVGLSTLRGWMQQFCNSITSHVKPFYMPCKPFGTEERHVVNWNFQSRRNIPNVVLACDGSHIPFCPKSISTKDDYKNYKGWHSILAVAFVDSLYRFFDISVGAPGRAGDNTVLRHNWLMKEMAADPDKWLGPGGVVLGDCGASDGDKFFLNPYYSARLPEYAWFNFCHSSTRFFVEETFGRWKNRWRFLMNHSNANHKLTTNMIYASAILHNYCTVNTRDNVPLLQRGGPNWTKFFEVFGVQVCMTCENRNVTHCVHEARFRNGHASGFKAMAMIRDAPSKTREDLCFKLWEDLLSGRSTGFLRGLEEDDEQLLLAEGAHGNKMNAKTVQEMRARVMHRNDVSRRA